jgi:uncharacterized repeat protein (TIGR01451 family)
MLLKVIQIALVGLKKTAGRTGTYFGPHGTLSRWLVGFLCVVTLAVPFGATAHAIQNSATGTFNGQSLDLTNATVTLNVTGNAVSSALAEINPNSVVVGSTGIIFTYDILPTINAGDTGIDEIAITVPAGYANLGVTGVQVGGIPQSLDCLLDNANEYCTAIAGQVITITLRDKVIVSGTNIQITFSADAPGVAGSADFTSTVDDTTTGVPFVSQASAAGDADGDMTDNNSITVQVTGDAVTSALAEISPNSIAAGSIGNAFTYDILPTVGGSDTGINEIVITAPAGYSGIAVTGVSVGGVARNANCALGPLDYCVNLVGQTITIELGSNAVNGIRITFDADAPAGPGTGNFTSTVDDNTSVNAAQATATGNADGDAGDNNSITVLVTGGAVTSAVAEISPNAVAVGSTGSVFTYDIRPTINIGDTGVNEIAIMVPAGYTTLSVSGVSVGGTPQGLDCLLDNANEYCVGIAGQVITVTLRDKVTTSGTNIRITLVADVPGIAGSADFTSTVDDSATGVPFVPQSTVAGNADGDAADANSITVNVAVNLPNLNYSTVVADPIIVAADGVSVSYVTTTLRDSSRLPIAGKDITLTSNRGIDIVTQPAAPTDANGVAVGTVASDEPGISAITSMDTTDGIAFPMRPVVYFTQGIVLDLTKTANKKEAVVGDVVTYLVEIRNTTDEDVTLVKVYDQIPPNFKYIKGSARLNGDKMANPRGNRPLVFDIGTVPARVDSNGNGRADQGEQGYMTLSYQLVIGSGATPGEYKNTVVARDVCDNCLISNSDRAEVTVTLDPLFDLGTIIGKVFLDRNSDGWQDKGEEGVPGAMVVLDDGTYVLTDEHGRYHFPAVKPGHRLLKINLNHLPLGAKATTREALIVSVTPGLLVKANFGVVYEYDEESIGREKEFGLAMGSEDSGDPIYVIGSTRNMALIINGKMAAIPSSSVRMRLENIHDVIEIKGGRLVKPVDFLISSDRPDEVTEWKVLVFNSDDTTIRTLLGNGPPPESVSWDGLTDQGQIVGGGEILQYQVVMEFTDGSRTASARRLFGVNKTSIVSLNLTGGAFKTGSDELSDEAKNVLNEAADALKEFPDEKVIIEGHADTLGPATINMDLSRRRAEAAVDYLVNEQGVTRDRFMVRWYGESMPIASNDTPEGRELNRRVEVKGEIKEIDEAKLYDQYRTEPEVNINGMSVFVDDYGRFNEKIENKEARELEVYVKNEQGRTLHTTVDIPLIEIIEPNGSNVMAYGTEDDRYRMLVHSEDELTDSGSPVMVHVLSGITDPGNTVELDGKGLTIGPDGTFTTEIPLKIGNNAFGIVAHTPDGYTRIANLIVVVSDRDENGEYIIAVKPEPYMTVKLPPKGAKLKEPSLAISGVTDPANTISVNGQPVEVRADGVFMTTVELPNGFSQLEIEATDPEGYSGSVVREVEVSKNDLFLLAFVDSKIGYLQGEGYLEGAGMEEAEEFYTEGRVAFYLKGYVAGKYLVTAALDTGTNEFEKLFDDLDDDEQERLLTNLDEDKLYPVYGDSSTIVYDTESQGKLYLAIESDEFNALLGNYQINLNDTELATFNRTLYGGKASYRSVSRTKYGDPDTKVVVYGAEIKQAHISDELKATGGSLYYLSHKDIIEGSEQVRIVIRDKQTGLIVSRIPQAQDVDYTIKYEEGRIMFNRPISSVVDDDRLIDMALLSGNPVSIQVDYEAELESFEKTGYGGRVRKQVGDHVAVGGTYVKDELQSGQYELQALDSEIRLGKNTKLIAEFAKSTGNDSTVFMSNDGGITYSAVTPDGELEGQAWKAAAELDIGEWFGRPDRFQVGGYYKKLESGFLSNGNFVERGTEKSGLNLRLQITEPDKLLARFDREEFEDDALSGMSRIDSGTIQLVHDTKRWTLTGEYQMNETEDTMGGTDSASLGALRLGVRLSDSLSVSAEYQHTITGETNDQTTLGVDYRLLDALTLNVKGTTGTLGDSVEGGAVLQIGDKRVYVVERITEDSAGHSTSTVVGSEAAIDDSSRVYTEYQWQHSEGDRKNLSIIGAQKDWEITRGLKLVLSGEHAKIESDQDESSRYAVALGLSYVTKGFKAATRDEVRQYEGNSETIQYLTLNSVEVKLSPDFTLLGKFKYSLTFDTTDDSTQAEFDEKVLGLAYRPVAFDRFNALAKYTSLSDQRPLSLGEMESSVTKTDVASVEWSLDVTRYLEWVEKGAYKIKTEETGDRDPFTSHTWLVINRFNLNVWRSIDFGVEYRILTQVEADDSRQGWLTELMWEAVKNFRLGVGFNFTDFSDNEFSDNNYSVYGWFIRLQAKY